MDMSLSGLEKKELVVDVESGSIDLSQDLGALEGQDVVVAKKMHLINDAIDQIGFTWFHVKLFVLAGFGYSADSQITLVQASVATFVNYQFGRYYPYSTEILYIGLLFGALFIGIAGDIIGRKYIFNTSLLLGCAFGFFAGGMNSFATYGIFLCLNSIALGGNLALDVTIFLEFLPFKYQWLTTLLACWWGVGQTIATLIAWAFLPSYSCDGYDNCPSHLNRGWRYCWYVNSGIVLICALARLFIFSMEESPKHLISSGKDLEAFEILQRVANKYGRPFTLELGDLQKCGPVTEEMERGVQSYHDFMRITKHHILILFATRKMAWSTILIFISWFVIGITYATYSNFLYVFIQSRGGDIGSSVYITYRDSSIATIVSIFGPILAGFLIFIPKVGRRGTMAIGGLTSMALLFGYTTVRTEGANLGFSSASYFAINIYFGCLYAYTPEVLPAAARTTGAGIALVMNRIAGTIAPVIAYYGDTSSPVPIYVCGACIGFIGLLALLFPFEPTNKRTM